MSSRGATSASRDPKNLPRLDELQPWLTPWARWLISAWPYGQVTSTLRSRADQARLYAAFLRGESRYPAAPPGYSRHEYGLAFDYVAEPLILERLGTLWESVGGTWGGRVGDPIHFE